MARLLGHVGKGPDKKPQEDVELSSGSSPPPLVNLTFEELKGKEHWWWDSLEPNDGGVTNDRALRRVYADVLALSRDREKGAAPEPGAAEHSCPVDRDSSSSFEDGACSSGGGEVAAIEPAAWSAGLRVTASEAATLEAVWPQRVELVSHNPATFSGRFGVRPLQHLFQGTRATLPFAADAAASAVAAAPGRGVESAAEVGPQSFKESAGWYRKAADQGHANAQFNLGITQAPGLAYAAKHGAPIPGPTADCSEFKKWPRNKGPAGGVPAAARGTSHRPSAGTSHRPVRRPG